MSLLEVRELRRLWSVAVFVVTVNALDLASTYAASPDLANEWNLLQRQFGLGWAGLVCAKLIGMALAVAGYAFYLRNRARLYPPPGADVHAFCRRFSFGADAGSPARLDNAGLILGVNLGYFWAGMQGLVLWVAIDNVLLVFGVSMPMRAYSEAGYHLLQSCVVALLVLVRFYAGNFRRYERLSATAVIAAPLADRPASKSAAR